jgi:hypothetical protein
VPPLQNLIAVTDREHRETLAEALARTTPVFGEKVSFREAFPEIAEFRLELETQNSYNYDWHTSVFSLTHTPGEFVNCGNSICYHGGFPVGELFRELVRERKTEHAGVLVCRGQETSPKGRAVYRSCARSANVTVRIRYVASEEPTATPGSTT